MIILLLSFSCCFCLKRWTSSFCCWALSCGCVVSVKLMNWTAAAAEKLILLQLFLPWYFWQTELIWKSHWEYHQHLGHLYRKWKWNLRWNQQRHKKLPMNCQNNNNKHSSEKPFFKVPCVLLLFSLETSYFVSNKIQVCSIWNCSRIFDVSMFLE